jgi:hypothetical protein
VHSISGENNYGEVDHYGNMGSLAVNKRSKLFQAIMKQVVKKAGYDGMKKLPNLPHQQFVPPVLGTKGLYSLSTETVDNDLSFPPSSKFWVFRLTNSKSKQPNSPPE